MNKLINTLWLYRSRSACSPAPDLGLVITHDKPSGVPLNLTSTLALTNMCLIGKCPCTTYCARGNGLANRRQSDVASHVRYLRCLEIYKVAPRTSDLL